MPTSVKPIRNHGVFDLNQIAAVLEGLEETIIFMLINRAQFAANAVVYEPMHSGFAGEGERSLFSIRLRMHEEMDAVFGRFCIPEERPFSKNLPAPKRHVVVPDTGLALDDYDAVNTTAQILPAYLKLLPKICLAKDDGQYGSSVEHDVMALQAVARRVHFGALYVAESKYQGNPPMYRELVADNNRDGLLAALTRAEVEERILKRVADKVAHIQAAGNPDVRRCVPADEVMNFYRKYVIPLTKEGEISYFLNRRC